MPKRRNTSNEVEVNDSTTTTTTSTPSKKQKQDTSKKTTKNTHSHLLPLDWNKRQIEEWLHEDIPSFDYGGYVVGKIF